MWLGLRLRLQELIGAYFAATFLWFIATREICDFRRSPVVEKGFVVPFSDKYGTCYASAYEGFWLHNVLWMVIPAVAIGFVVQVPRANIADMSRGRFLAFGMIILTLYGALWFLS
jgi:hypothetical protein